MEKSRLSYLVANTLSVIIGRDKAKLSEREGVVDKTIAPSMCFRHLGVRFHGYGLSFQMGLNRKR